VSEFGAYGDADFLTGGKFVSEQVLEELQVRVFAFPSRAQVVIEHGSGRIESQRGEVLHDPIVEEVRHAAASS
jgi:hypothetical protein